MESVEPMLNMVLNKPEEDTLEEVPPSPQPSPPAENTPWNTHPNHKPRQPTQVANHPMCLVVYTNHPIYNAPPPNI